MAPKREIKAEVYAAKKRAKEQKFANILRLDDDEKKIFKEQMMKNNHDFVREKCVWDDSGLFTFTDNAKKKDWKSHHQQLLNEEFDWKKGNPPEIDKTDPSLITIELGLNQNQRGRGFWKLNTSYLR